MVMLETHRAVARQSSITGYEAVQHGRLTSLNEADALPTLTPLP